MRPFDVQSIGIACPVGQAFAFLSDPRNLPRWTSAFVEADARSARLVTPAGEQRISLKTMASAEHGTIDWIMTFDPGVEARACSRLSANGDDACVYCFVLEAPPAPLEELEGALAAQRVTLERELKKLKTILEAA